jgi:hypothetical protein
MIVMGDSGAKTPGSKANVPPANSAAAAAASVGARRLRRRGVPHALAVRGKVAASTQNQAKSALLFLYGEVLGVEVPWLDNIEKAKAPS